MGTLNLYTIRQFFFGIVITAIAMTLFTYNWLEKYFEQKTRLNQATIEELDFIGHIPQPEFAIPQLPVLSPIETNKGPDHVLYPDQPSAEDQLRELEELNKQNSESKPLKDLPWEEIKAKAEQKKGELSFEGEDAALPASWELDEKNPEAAIVPKAKSPQDLSFENQKDTDLSFDIINDVIAKAQNFDAKESERLVHIDLKGAPMKPSYLEELFSKISEWGATGIIVEYEDTFPFTGDFEKVKSKQFTYSVEEIKRINLAAEKNNLTVIPYISLFDDLDFLLRDQSFKKYREMSHFSEMISPLHEGSELIAAELAQQVAELHPNSKFLHIGARAPEMLGWSLLAKQWMHRHEKSPQELYLDYVARLVDQVKSRTHKNIIIWGNTLMTVPQEALALSGIHKNVYIMMESYKDKNLDFDDLALAEYGRIFPGVFLAGSFKGTAHSSRSIPNIMEHVKNVNEILNLAKDISPKRVPVKGTVIMGNARSHHSSSLSELLPVCIPSMISCLIGMKAGEVSTLTTYSAAKAMELRGGELPDMSWPRPLPPVGGTFPGSKAWLAVQNLENQLYDARRVLDGKNIKLYLTEYHTKDTIADVMPIKDIKLAVTVQLTQIEKHKKIIEEILQDIYYYDTIAEFLEEHLEPVKRQLAALNSQVQDILNRDSL